jgi:hypothetical protein
VQTLLYMGTYPVQPPFSCNHRATQLTMFIKNLKKFTDVLCTLLYLHIEFQDQIHYWLATTKKRNFWQICEIRSVRNFVFLLLFRSYEFDLEILYVDRVGLKEHLWIFSDFLINICPPQGTPLIPYHKSI